MHDPDFWNSTSKIVLTSFQLRCAIATSKSNSASYASAESLSTTHPIPKKPHLGSQQSNQQFAFLLNIKRKEAVLVVCCIRAYCFLREIFKHISGPGPLNSEEKVCLTKFVRHLLLTPV
jgi:hypothetical protein